MKSGSFSTVVKEPAKYEKRERKEPLLPPLIRQGNRVEGQSFKAEQLIDS